MMQRCYNPNRDSFSEYGGRGIKVCARWHTFENFVADMGPRPAGMTLERINNDGDYEPSNCKWATRLEQAMNRRSNTFLELNGERLTASEWSARLGISKATICKRRKAGRSDEQCLSTTT